MAKKINGSMHYDQNQNYMRGFPFPSLLLLSTPIIPYMSYYSRQWMPEVHNTAYMQDISWKQIWDWVDHTAEKSKPLINESLHEIHINPTNLSWSSAPPLNHRTITSNDLEFELRVDAPEDRSVRRPRSTSDRWTYVIQHTDIYEVKDKEGCR